MADKKPLCLYEDTLKELQAGDTLSPVSDHAALTGTAVHGLGTASTADVTTSATDTTAGRLLKVGDFGVGAIAAAQIDDFAKHWPGGIYKCVGSAHGSLNAPWSENTLGSVLVIRPRSDMTAFIVTRFTGEFYVSVFAGSLGAWQRICSDDKAQVIVDSAVAAHNALTGTAVHGLGTASTANVTTSATDATAGRLLKVGDFGIGSQHDLRGTIFVTGTPSSVYGKGHVTGMCAGGPDGLNITPWIPSANSYGVLEVSSHWGDPSAIYATIRRFTQLGNVYIQYAIDSNTWGPWRKCYGNQDVLGTVSNYSGLPSGAIVQKVSVAQGTATLFADGLVVCNSFTDDVAVDTAVGNIYKASTPIIHVLPYELNVAYGLVTAYCSSITINTRWHNAIYWGPGQVRIDSYASGIQPVSEGINVVAIGRWY